jgi:hypothetical protein
MMPMLHSELTDKASGIISLSTVLRERLEPPVWERVLASLHPKTRAIIEHPPMPMTWIPHEHFFSLVLACNDVAWGGRPEPIYDISREMMRRDMTSVYKVLMHLASTETVIKKASAIYSTYTHNGKMTPKMLGPTHAEITVGPVLRGHPCAWEFQRGAIMGVLEVAGTKSPSVRIKDGGGHSVTATFDITWK